MAKDKENRFRGGKRKARDKHFGINDDAFWNWWHQQEKDKYGGEDLKRDEAWELYDQWQKDGCPEG